MVRSLLLPLFLFVPFTSTLADKPNVILVMCDDLGWGDVGFNGSKVAKTPHLDQMARSSLLFTRWYAAAPVCSPTRGASITGRHPFRYGIYFANTGHMRHGEMTLAEALKPVGYRTGHFGKWHLGTLTCKTRDANRGGPKGVNHYALPTHHGFDEYFSTESKVPTWDPMRVPKKFAEGESRRYGWATRENADDTEPYGTHYWNGEETMVTENLDGSNSKVIMDRALPFIRAAASEQEPFFAVIWFHTPHLPVVASNKHREPYKDLGLKEQLYYGCISAMDEQVGRLRKELRTLNIADNTMLWFSSDNGPENGTPGSQGPFRDRKRSLYEGGVRVPGLLEWPAKIRTGRKTDVPAVSSDHFPTVLDVLGLKPEPIPPVDGVSLLPLIEGEMTNRPQPIAFQSGNTATLSDNRFKLVIKKKTAKNSKKKNDKKAKPGDANPGVELYDLLADPGEAKNVADQHPDVVKTMQSILTVWIKSCANSDAGKDYAK